MARASNRARTRVFLAFLGCAVVAPAVGAQAREFRSFDGSGNNLRHPAFGSAGTKLLRLTTPDYADGRSAPAGDERPGAREISNACVAQKASIPNALGVTDFFWVWGQFVDHDISITGSASPPEPFDIPVPVGDPHFDPHGTGGVLIPFSRSIHTRGRVRQQINEITAWIDASMVYGSNEERARALRGRGGEGDRLRTSRRRMLPFNSDGFPNAPSDRDASMFLAGDVRANENVALTAMHTLFVREHNRIVRLLRRQKVQPAEQRYERARALVAAEIQAITYNEFLPLLLGPAALDATGGYRDDLNPGISNIFSTACYRFGHSMLPTELMRLRRRGRPIHAGPLALRDAFFNPGELLRSGLDPVLRGLAVRRAQEVDTRVVDDVRNFLFGPPGAGGFDLAALNIQRGRDHGLPSYNQARADLGLPRAESFADLTSNELSQQELSRVYGAVDKVDLWVGALVEDHVPGAMVGELAFHVLRDQFERLRDADRFWYRRALTPEEVAWVEEHTLARIIRLNTGIRGELRDDPFRMP